MKSELFKCNSFTVYSNNRQVEDFLADLSPRDWERFASVAELFTRVLLTGAPAVDRVEKISGASNKLYELKITPPGSKGPQLRVLCVVRGRTIVCLRGIDKRAPRLPTRAIEAADRAATNYLKAEDDREAEDENQQRVPP